MFTTAPREHVAILQSGYRLRASLAATGAGLRRLGRAHAGPRYERDDRHVRDRRADHVQTFAGRSRRAAHFDQQSVPVPVSRFLQDFQDYRARTSVLLGRRSATCRASLPSVSTAARSASRFDLVTDNYFSMLGVQPAAGRLIRPDEGRAPGDAPVLVLWPTTTGSPASAAIHPIVGRSVRLGSQPFTVIGVASRSFTRHGVAAACGRIRASVDGRRVLEVRAAEVRASRIVRCGVPFRAGAIEARRLARAGARGPPRSAPRSWHANIPRSHKDVSLRVIPETQARPNPELGGFLRSRLDGPDRPRRHARADHQRERGQPDDGARRQPQTRGRAAGRAGRQTWPVGETVPDRGVTLALLGGMVSIPLVVLAMTLTSPRRVGCVGGRLPSIPTSASISACLPSMLVMAIGAGVVAGLAPAFVGVPRRSRGPSHERRSRHRRTSVGRSGARSSWRRWRCP